MRLNVLSANFVVQTQSATLHMQHGQAEPFFAYKRILRDQNIASADLSDIL